MLLKNTTKNTIVVIAIFALVIWSSPIAVFAQDEKKPAKTNPAAEAKKAAEKAPEVPRRDDAGLLVSDKMVLDFGKVEPKSKNNGEFILTNNGKEVLEIEKVGKSCGCTVPELKTKVLQPGQSVPLSVTYSANNRPGKVTKNVWIETKAPHKPKRLTMKLTAEIVRYLKATPEKLKLNIQEQSEPQKLVIESTDGTEFKITKAYCNTDGLTVDFDKEAKANKHELTLKTNIEGLRKSQHGTIIVSVDHAKAKDIKVSYTAIKPFSAKPRSKYFRDLKPGISSEAEFEVVSNFGQEFEIDNIKSNNGSLEVISSEKSKNGYKVKYRLNVPQEAKGRVQDYFDVTIKGFEKDVLRVDCFGRLKN